MSSMAVASRVRQQLAQSKNKHIRPGSDSDILEGSPTRSDSWYGVATDVGIGRVMMSLSSYGDSILGYSTL